MSSITARDQRLGQGAVLLCAVLWSTSGLFIKLIDWHPVIIAGVRSFLAGVFMLAVRMIFNRAMPFVFNWPAGIAYAVTTLLFVSANKMTTSANAILLQYSAPVWAVLLAWVLAKETPRKSNLISLALLMGGLVLFFKDGFGGGSFAGDLFALLSGITFGASSVFMRMQKKRRRRGRDDPGAVSYRRRVRSAACFVAAGT